MDAPPQKKNMTSFLKDPYRSMTLGFFSHNILHYYGWLRLKRWKAWQDKTRQQQQYNKYTGTRDDDLSKNT